MSRRALPLLVAALCAVLICTTAQSSVALSLAGTAPAGAAPKPPIAMKLIPFGPKRRVETAAYAQRHYGTATWRLERPKVIVEHYTASNSLSSAYSTFAADTPDGEFGELPGVCAHS